MTVELDCRNIRNIKALHTYLAFEMRYPDWYGKNLDALHDMLTSESDTVTLVCRISSALPEEMKEYWKRMEQVMEDSSRENPRFTYKIVEE